MQALGIGLAVIGAILVVIAYMRGRAAGAGIVDPQVDVAEAKRPPQREQSLMGFGVGLLVVGLALAFVANV